MAQQDFHIVNRITRAVADLADLSHGFTQNLLFSIVLIFGFWLFRTVVLRIVYRKSSDPELHYKWRKYLTRFLVFIALLVLGRTWFEGFQSVATFLGLLSAGLIIALKDSVADLAGWIFLMWRKPFEIGDRIDIAGVSGDVIDQRIFKFSLMEIGNWVDADQSTGRVIHIPNHKVFTENIANYTADFQFIWNELPVRVSMESNWKKAKMLLQKIADRHTANISDEAKQQLRRAARSYLITYRILTPTVYTDVKDFGISLTIRYLTNPRTRRGTEQQIWEDVLTEFSKHDDISFAYPTIRYFDRGREGHTGWGMSDTEAGLPPGPGPK
ncbi:mechanosensitive ion channel [Balneolales bacterium ANBcel1]|nr:mechanosensitive ion channel [Balneolales bacterium ANBcel1]